MNKAEEVRRFAVAFRDKVVTDFLFEKLVDVQFNRAIRAIEKCVSGLRDEKIDFWISGCKRHVESLGLSRFDSFPVPEGEVVKIVEAVTKKLQAEGFWVSLKETWIDEVWCCGTIDQRHKHWIIEVRW
ncbi:MAG: hypothetical protein HY226_02175 [Candidatus Vogelbacteria bacterium]|nr:hypothetical protein [Candidatus Vogelbacteria bacterium]